MASENNTLLKLKMTIDQLENLALELKQMGQGVPAIEKNSRSILCAVFNLKLGVSDIADMDTE